ncbi:unnamed protein product [Owenia fusiformis]|uniref:Uncharacterized protein n=1 Tax=Owenia fusiformis TaxID=6347 RepID=A0A8J1XYF8_OWEFU|nr:unnamed protein product [Owenia fusiformis]
MTTTSTDAYPIGGRETVLMTKPVAGLSEYNFSHKRRGKALIINNRNFDAMLTGQMDRDGTDIDADAITARLTDLGFDVDVLHNLTTTKMSFALRNAAEEDHSDADCFVCVILSHGRDGRVYGIDGTITIESLLRHFKGDECQTLAGKPKLFFIQACRGTKFDHGAEVTDAATDEGMDEIDAAPVVRIPSEADIMIAYSTVPGHFSWRNNVDGSWFIQALCRVLKEHSHDMDLMHMMTFVNQIVAYEHASCTDDDFTSNMKQIPSIVSMLTKLVYFRRN